MGRPSWKSPPFLSVVARTGMIRAISRAIFPAEFRSVNNPMQNLRSNVTDYHILQMLLSNTTPPQKAEINEQRAPSVVAKAGGKTQHVLSLIHI